MSKDKGAFMNHVTVYNEGKHVKSKDFYRDSQRFEAIIIRYKNKLHLQVWKCKHEADYFVTDVVTDDLLVTDNVINKMFNEL